MGFTIHVAILLDNYFSSDSIKLFYHLAVNSGKCPFHNSIRIFNLSWWMCQIFLSE